VLALHVLESNQWTNKFFSLWFSNIDSFARVHDKKLSIAAIVSLLTLNADQVPVSVQTGWPRLLQGIVRLFQTLPAAQKSKWWYMRHLRTCTNNCIERDEVLKDDFPLDQSAYDDYEDEEEEQWAGDDNQWNDDNEQEEESEVKDESTAYLEFLNEEVCGSRNCQNQLLTLPRHKNSRISRMKIPTKSLVRRVFSRHLLIRWSRI
jgi:hypothetical protein